jgi:hypothetical protein
VRATVLRTGRVRQHDSNLARGLCVPPFFRAGAPRAQARELGLRQAVQEGDDVREVVVAHRGGDDRREEEHGIEEFLAELGVDADQAAARGEVSGAGLERCGAVFLQDVFVDFVSEFTREREEGG